MIGYAVSLLVIQKPQVYLMLNSVFTQAWVCINWTSIQSSVLKCRVDIGELPYVLYRASRYLARLSTAVCLSVCLPSNFSNTMEIIFTKIGTQVYEIYSRVNETDNGPNSISQPSPLPLRVPQNTNFLLSRLQKWHFVSFLGLYQRKPRTAFTLLSITWPQWSHLYFQWPHHSCNNIKWILPRLPLIVYATCICKSAFRCTLLVPHYFHVTPHPHIRPHCSCNIFGWILSKLTLCVFFKYAIHYSHSPFLYPFPSC